ncbi:MAG: hypothetical protein IPG28_14330 [Betaproteobacteria bacterium]|nr:hypothetical protein [Betaproteobacteria bacterium]MBK6602682.1 hypothetical protein [Betaproteobacteria bacterium]MBK9676649.1 hypothetical protein [Betaproteobacteria bacterium]
MIASLRLGIVALLCAGLTGCVTLAAAGLGPAAQGVLTVALSPVITMYVEATKARCSDLANRDIAVTERVEIAIPTDEGEVLIFQVADWQPEFEGEGYPERKRAWKPTRGTLAVTDRSIIMMPPPDLVGVRVPYEIVLEVEIDPVNPHRLIVSSCFGRYDIFSFWHEQQDTFDPEAAAAVGARVKVRAVAIRASVDKGTQLPK